MSKNLLFLTLLFLIFFSFYTDIYGQTKAVTEYGDTIYVYDNGTWSFEQLEDMPQSNSLAYLSSELQLMFSFLQTIFAL
ncbi:MAG: hypothetical protein AAFO82_07895 [Bacteroidota bacterium]